MAETVVRPHTSKHDAIAELPLVTESARVTHVASMDRDRRDEVRAAIEEELAEHGLDETYPEVTGGPADWRRLRERLHADDYHELARQVATLTERYTRPKPMLVRARFRPDEPFEFLAGQYLGLRYDGTSRAYSIASAPSRDTVEICVRRVPGGRLSPRLCDDLSVGDRVTLRGPYGDLVLQEPSGRDMVFLATGTGVAPFKGMIDHVFETGRDEYRGTKRDVWLFLGAAWADDLPYLAAFRERAAEHDNFHFVPTVSREPILGAWPGETDYVQYALLKHVDPATVTTGVGRLDRWLRREPESDEPAALDPGGMDVYACGINAMVHGLVEAAERVGVPPRRIESEGFG